MRKKTMELEELEKALKELPSDKLDLLLQGIKREVHSEPELYVRLDQEGIDIEIPKGKAVAMVKEMAKILNPKRISIEYEAEGRWERMRIFKKELEWGFDLIRKVLEGGIAVIEYDKKTLFSNGDGCMFLKMDSDIQIKRELVESILCLCGFSAKLEDKPFSVIVKGNRIEVIYR